MRTQPPILAGPIPLIWFADFSSPPPGAVLRGQCWQSLGSAVRCSSDTEEAGSYSGTQWTFLDIQTDNPWPSPPDCLNVPFQLPRDKPLAHLERTLSFMPLPTWRARVPEAVFSRLFSRLLGWSNTLELKNINGNNAKEVTYNLTMQCLHLPTQNLFTLSHV